MAYLFRYIFLFPTKLSLKVLSRKGFTTHLITVYLTMYTAAFQAQYDN